MGAVDKWDEKGMEKKLHMYMAFFGSNCWPLVEVLWIRNNFLGSGPALTLISDLDLDLACFKKVGFLVTQLHLM